MEKKRKHPFEEDKDVDDLLDLDDSDLPVHEPFVRERKMKKVRDIKEF
jgi:hypothetical protein